MNLLSRLTRRPSLLSLVVGLLIATGFGAAAALLWQWDWRMAVWPLYLALAGTLYLLVREFVREYQGRSPTR